LEYLEWHFNTSSRGAAASVVGGKHATTVHELGTPTTAKRQKSGSTDQGKLIQLITEPLLSNSL
jgi:hypothetical protein